MCYKCSWPPYTVRYSTFTLNPTNKSHKQKQKFVLAFSSYRQHLLQASHIPQQNPPDPALGVHVSQRIVPATQRIPL